MAVFSFQCSVFSFQEAVHRKETQERKGAAATTTTVFTTTTQRHKDTTTERRLATEGTEITEFGTPRRYLPRGSGGVAAAAAGAGEQVIVEQ